MSSLALARIKPVACRRPRYATMPPSPSGGVALSRPLSPAGQVAARKSVDSSLARFACVDGSGRENYALGHWKVTSQRVKEMESLGYFPASQGWATGAETVPRLDGEVLVFEGLFVDGLRLLSHGFLVEVLEKFKVQIHQLTPNVVVALSKFVWATTTIGGGPSAEVFTKHYRLHWKKVSLGAAPSP